MQQHGAIGRANRDERGSGGAHGAHTGGEGACTHRQRVKDHRAVVDERLVDVQIEQSKTWRDGHTWVRALAVMRESGGGCGNASDSSGMPRATSSEDKTELCMSALDSMTQSPSTRQVGVRQRGVAAEAVLRRRGSTHANQATQRWHGGSGRTAAALSGRRRGPEASGTCPTI